MAGVGLFALILCAAWLPGQNDDSKRVIELWRAAPAGQSRAKLVQAELGACEEQDLPALQKGAYDLFLEDMLAYRGRSAERIGIAMHGRAFATWSMICLSGSQLRTGQLEPAMATVREHLARIEDSAPMEEVRAVWDRLALVARGAGMQDEMLDALGNSLAMGSEDALQLLGWDELVAGNWTRSARLFSTLIDRGSSGSTEPAPWALPGWGLSLLENMAE